MTGERLGYAPGVFDLFHVGHLNILRRARGHCDRLIAGVCSDELVVRMKGRPPVVPLSERLQIVRSVRYVDETFVATVEDKMETWREVGFDVIFKGDDWLGTDVWTNYETEFARVGVEVVYFPYTVHTSSTLLRDALHLLAQRDPSTSLSGQLAAPRRTATES
ncbi:adenylyltransferase/cytidyltransferase family protein [Streptomyces sp. ISL-22]|uniref:Cytidyltransferase n=1 Tax=Streptomyces curacoi TaxID=146536 RepID=A0A117P6P0_9ACTN|nr:MULTISPECIES: adenylyltransferase/cytidyltransferase family protein [Streptomyces]KUM74061.1 cytidyltransferase [Streptomyces curacoi]MBT2419265.1 adenylyltransferase/cytidyltransferase family protein [Streptomyces sp. ISL-24]MBT2430827.1 adenylyltransferase/cytidyltransferase family protein [Streptomyces sp. ISL-22]